MTGNKYEKYYCVIEKDQKYFEYILEKIKNSSSIEEKLELSDLALNYAVSYNTGYYTSSIIEKVYTDYAKTINIDIENIQYQENSFLHVLTEGYNKGGHTRVVERWIENAPAEQKHSVVLTRPNSSKLQDLENAVQKKCGQYISFNNTLSLEEKSLKLRELGMHYQYIILHTHMEDPIATAAFGTDKFKRPVMFYNHASHLFWIGKSVTDLLLDLKKDDIVTKYRNIKNRFYLGIPTKNLQFSVIDKKDFRNQLGFPCDKKIIISAGTNDKYKPICNDNIVDIFMELINEDTYIYVIGANKNSSMWKKAFKNSNGHIKALGYINFDKDYLKYIGSADLYLDSYPMNGWTATMDAITMNVPVLSLEPYLPQLDYLVSTNACCKTKEELIAKAKEILSDKNYSDNHFNEIKKSLIQHHSTEAWNSRIQQLLQQAPKTHKVTDLSNEIDNKFINDLAVSNNLHTKRNELLNFNEKDVKKYLKYGMIYKHQRIKYILDIILLKRHNLKTKIIKLFGIEIYKHTKNIKK